ncbi:MAG: hypothetical protein J6I35_09565 [Ruminobacter sp.]|uniref:hypothetical protein n=1 Tax=Ruminobacter sp. TaxID=2774296 RepID=UPI001B51F002|nr:hypothetical protein [Ruminobacter sp.]MBP3749770.1 hypothetical protein [Ruminobacter sp.]
MQVFEYGNRDAETVLIQLADEHDLSLMSSEADAIRREAGENFRLIALKVNDWNDDLSPWKSPAVFGNQDFGGRAEETLQEVLKFCSCLEGVRYIGGYSLAGLFALWAVYRTDVFNGAAAASPSIWFPGFTDFMKENVIKCPAVYLSLGDREDRTRNPVMASVADRISEARGILDGSGTDCTLEWNRGGHFCESDTRTARAFAWLMLRDGGR